MPTLPSTLDADLERLGSLVAAYQSQQVPLAQFKAYRVPMGVYEQRQNERYMNRIRCTGGRITPSQLLFLIEAARRHGCDLLHITTRQEIQTHNLDLSEVLPLLNELKQVQLCTKGGGGNTIRNIMACSTSGICPDEVFDVTPCVEAVAELLLQQADSYELPRKVKMCFSSQRDPGFAAIADLGLHARIVDGRQGFRVYVGGGLGGKPTVASVLYDFLPQEDILALVMGLKAFFNATGNRKNRSQARLRFVFYKYGTQQASEMLRGYVDRAREATPRFEYVPIAEERQRPQVDYAGGVELSAEEAPLYEQWKRRYVSAQRQAGYASVYVPFTEGNLPLSDEGYVQHLCDFLRFVQRFGEDTIRFTPQNMRLRNLPEAALPELYRHLRTFNPAADLPVFINSITSCTGADTCRLGVCLSKGLAGRVRRRLLDSGLDLEPLAGSTLRISGCPNSCGQHLWADLGFSGRVLRNERSYPAYKFVAGARSSPEPALASDVGSLAAWDAPVMVEQIIRDYLDTGAAQPFGEYIQERSARKELTDYALRFKNIPSFADDKNYYFDLGADTIFTREVLGTPECAAGLFDMLKVDHDAIRSALEALDAAGDDDERRRQLSLAVFHSARLLLVTRGLDPKNRTEVFDFFIRSFIREGIVDPRFTFLAELARNDEHADFLPHATEVRELADCVVELYLSLDDTLQFKRAGGQDEAPSAPAPAPAPASDREAARARARARLAARAAGGTAAAAAPSPAPASSSAAAPAAPASAPAAAAPAPAGPQAGDGEAAFKDLRGVACPMNFVMTKLELAKLEAGDRLRILLDDGQPIANVPRSVEDEGHKVILQQKMDPGDYYQVVIEKT